MKSTPLQAATTSHSSASPPCPPTAPLCSSMDSVIQEWKHLKVFEAEDAGDKDDVELAVNAGREAFDYGTWPQMSGYQRGRIVSKLADLIDVEEFAYLVTKDAGQLFGFGTVMDIPGAAQPTHCYTGTAVKVYGDTPKMSRDFQGYTLWEPMTMTKGRMRTSKVVRDKGVVWLEKLIMQPIPLSKIMEEQKLANGGPKNIKCKGIIYAFAFVMIDAADQTNFSGSSETLPIKASSDLGWEFPIYQHFWGFVGPDVVNFVKNWWDGRASIAGIIKTICFVSEDYPTACSGGFDLSWRRVTCSLSFPHLYFLGDISLDVLCFEAMRPISVLLLDYDESDSDLSLQCFLESIDPSVDGCTSRQRSLKGGCTETLDATGEILSRKDDCLNFLVLYLYFDICCNHNISV